MRPVEPGNVGVDTAIGLNRFVGEVDEDEG
jgi:hypothetical protein